MLNKFGPSGHGEAQVQYLDGDFRVVSPGTYVRCAITDVRIPLDELKYWSVDLQEAYSVPTAVLQRHFPGALKTRVEICRRVPAQRRRDPYAAAVIIAARSVTLQRSHWMGRGVWVLAQARDDDVRNFFSRALKS